MYVSRMIMMASTLMPTHQCKIDEIINVKKKTNIVWSIFRRIILYFYIVHRRKNNRKQKHIFMYIKHEQTNTKNISEKSHYIQKERERQL